MARMERNEIVSILREPEKYPAMTVWRALVLAGNLLEVDVQRAKKREDKIIKQWNMIKRLRKENSQLQRVVWL
jgi:ABC-type multidrug transport system ATPase subunit